MKKLENIVWNVFLIWATVGLLILAARITIPPWMAWADAFFMILAAANILFATAKRDGWQSTWISFVVVMVGSGVVETVGAITGWPFGNYYYTDAMGLRLGGVLPFTIPLAWWAVLGSGHHLICLWLKSRPRFRVAALVAAWATAVDWVMEPFAWRVKVYWQWNHVEVPPQNYLSWFVLAFVLSLLAPWGNRPIDRFDPRPVAVAAYMLATFILGRIMYGV